MCAPFWSGVQQEARTCRDVPRPGGLWLLLKGDIFEIENIPGKWHKGIRKSAREVRRWGDFCVVRNENEGVRDGIRREIIENAIR